MLMLDPLKEGVSYRLDNHRIVDSFSGETILMPQKGLESVKNDRYYQGLRKANVDYFSRSKNLGVIDSEMLAEIGWRNIDAVDSIDKYMPDADLLTAETYELAASAFTEAAFVQARDSSNSVDTVDERLDLIDLADECLRLAIESMPEAQTTLKQRLQIKIDFGRIHRDIVCGEITEESVKEVIAHLSGHLYRTFDNEDAIHSRGLAGEIRVLLEDWQAYQKGSGLVAIPATVRGDSGFYLRNDTHDIDLIKQDDDGNWEICTPKEVKRRKILDWMMKRYTGSDLIYTNPIGGTRTVNRATTFDPLATR